MVSRLSLIREMFRTRTSKVVGGAITVVAAYDVGCNQFGWPKIPKLWGMTGALLPLWGWLLLAQFGFLYLLFDYVRRTTGEPIPDDKSVRPATKGASNYNMGRNILLSVATTRSSVRRDSSTRGIERAFFPIRALMITLTKEKGIEWPPTNEDPVLNLESALRIMEQIGPLIQSGHDEEAKQLSAELSRSLTPKGEA